MVYYGVTYLCTFLLASTSSSFLTETKPDKRHYETQKFLSSQKESWHYNTNYFNVLCQQFDAVAMEAAVNTRLIASLRTLDIGRYLLVKSLP